MLRTFIMLQLLSSLWQDDERWQENVANSVANGWTLATDGDDGEMLTRDLRCDELEFVEDGTVQVYDFAGSATEDERFYGKGVVVYKVKATGEYCVMYTEGIDEF